MRKNSTKSEFVQECIKAGRQCSGSNEAKAAAAIKKYIEAIYVGDSTSKKERDSHQKDYHNFDEKTEWERELQGKDAKKAKKMIALHKLYEAACQDDLITKFKDFAHQAIAASQERQKKIFRVIGPKLDSQAATDLIAILTAFNCYDENKVKKYLEASGAVERNTDLAVPASADNTSSTTTTTTSVHSATSPQQQEASRARGVTVVQPSRRATIRASQPPAFFQNGAGSTEGPAGAAADPTRPSTLTPALVNLATHIDFSKPLDDTAKKRLTALLSTPEYNQNKMLKSVRTNLPRQEWDPVRRSWKYVGKSEGRENKLYNITIDGASIPITISHSIIPLQDDDGVTWYYVIGALTPADKKLLGEGNFGRAMFSSLQFRIDATTGEFIIRESKEVVKAINLEPESSRAGYTHIIKEPALPPVSPEQRKNQAVHEAALFPHASQVYHNPTSKKAYFAEPFLGKIPLVDYLYGAVDMEASAMSQAIWNLALAYRQLKQDISTSKEKKLVCHFDLAPRNAVLKGEPQKHVDGSITAFGQLSIIDLGLALAESDFEAPAGNLDAPKEKWVLKKEYLEKVDARMTGPLRQASPQYLRKDLQGGENGAAPHYTMAEWRREDTYQFAIMMLTIIARDDELAEPECESQPGGLSGPQRFAKAVSRINNTEDLYQYLTTNIPDLEPLIEKVAPPLLIKHMLSAQRWPLDDYIDLIDFLMRGQKTLFDMVSQMTGQDFHDQEISDRYHKYKEELEKFLESYLCEPFDQSSALYRSAPLQGMAQELKTVLSSNDTLSIDTLQKLNATADTAKMSNMLLFQNTITTFERGSELFGACLAACNFYAGKENSSMVLQYFYLAISVAPPEKQDELIDLLKQYGLFQEDKLCPIDGNNAVHTQAQMNLCAKAQWIQAAMPNLERFENSHPSITKLFSKLYSSQNRVSNDIYLIMIQALILDFDQKNKNSQPAAGATSSTSAANNQSAFFHSQDSAGATDYRALAIELKRSLVQLGIFSEKGFSQALVNELHGGNYSAQIQNFKDALSDVLDPATSFTFQ